MGQNGILLIGNYPPPFGGVPKHIEDLVPYLVSQGWDVHVLSGGTGEGVHGHGYTVYRDGRPPMRRGLETVGFVGRSLGTGRGSALLRASRMAPFPTWRAYMYRASIAARIVARNHIRLISGYNLLSGVPIGAIVAEMFSLPLVVNNFGEIYSHREQVLRQLSLIRRIVDQAAVCLTLTRHCANSYREVGLDPPVQVIHYGIDVNSFAVPPSTGIEVRHRFGFSGEDPVVLFVGRLIRDMGLHTVLDAIPRVLAARGDVRFLLAGADGELTSAARSAASQWPGNVGVAVDVPSAELPAFYAAATLTVAPTLGARACGSLAAAEAMASGKPVIASRIGGIPEYVDEGKTGWLVPPDDPARLADAILQMLSDPPLLRSMGENGRRRAQEVFNTEVSNREIERVFARVAAQA